MGKIVSARAWANNEVAYVAWEIDDTIVGCLGFEVTRVYLEADGTVAKRPDGSGGSRLLRLVGRFQGAEKPPLAAAGHRRLAGAEDGLARPHPAQEARRHDPAAGRGAGALRDPAGRGPGTRSAGRTAQRQGAAVGREARRRGQPDSQGQRPTGMGEGARLRGGGAAARLSRAGVRHQRGRRLRAAGGVPLDLHQRHPGGAVAVERSQRGRGGRAERAHGEDRRPGRSAPQVPGR